MSALKVKLSLPVVAPLLDVIKDLTGDLQRTPAIGAEPPVDDEELREAWQGELVEGQTRDVATLMGLFGDEFFADGVVYFDAKNAEAIARAASAIRLRLREKFLKALGDEALESGEVDAAVLPDPQRKAFICYLFLATIQELIIQHLDESILG